MDIEEAVASLTGTCGMFIEELAKDAGVSVDKLMNAAEEQNIFECSVCGWWDEAEAFIDSEPFCHQCLEEREDG
jgi:hypothetical protein